ncbi:uncharacterized protein LOC115719713 isoform X1 [Cannabis sativa]|uniref:uncharacterized protein LOC115719713 isoform X1 n=1 Tax=Cannabis sativa TaxID=3483 RepID=UPI0029CA4718|nr:uncharacterized protein LOC115719713 isoform X1 [Cannabis sativa]XP_060965859.1 uncharacterized protein LOC115719713 isoform X1 [Cannabis sativa]XP_060965860.1 uncharacterized protein LOC115719713 isoform X1 [Cannabis sativa]XP_060965861.1 uncharacterized protein LOC115719713 isoform X1 [Cannabis sativa]XP_060965862.1 uncharacterized protein LOC115719713 isoform X1 [Cannabis sativa]XP_060965863.1 uncharacterized protein LOC115719713 isoform X1 [Cannabis sativa]
MNQLKELVKRLKDELLQKKASGELVVISSNDVFAEALGKPKHLGRIRGKGMSVCEREVFKKPPRSTYAQLLEERLQDKQEKQEIKHALKSMEVKFSSLEAQLKMITSQFFQSQPSQAQSKNAVDPQSKNADDTQPSQAQSKNAVDPQSEYTDDTQPRYVDDIQLGYGDKHQLDLVDDAHIHSIDDIRTLDSQGQPCRLTIEPSYEVVAKGYIISIDSVDKIHCVPVFKSLRVCIYEVIDADANLPNAMSDEIVKVGDAIDTFLSWFKHLVLKGFETPSQPKIKITRRKKSQSSPIAPITQPQGKETLPSSSSSVKTSSLRPNDINISSHFPKSLIACAKIYLKQKGSLTCTITALEDVFGKLLSPIYLYRDDITQFIHLQEISASIISLYMRFRRKVLIMINFIFILML